MKRLSTFLTLAIAGLMSMQVQALNVLACEPEWQSLTQTLAGDLAKVTSATTAFQNPHHIQARPSLLARARNADLIVCTGAELESGWLPLLIRKSGNSNIQQGQQGYFMAADFVELQNKSTQVDRSEGDVHGSGDPHFFLSPHYISKIAQALSLRLQQLDPTNQAVYQKHLTAFNTRWSQSISAWEEQAKSLKGVNFVVHHKSWFYLSQWLGFNMIATLEPKPGLPPTSSHLGKILTQIKQQPVAGIITSAYQNTKAASWLQGKTQLPIISLPYTVGGDNDTNDLHDLFTRTITLLLTSHHD
jgi:zinc/manganese transport system substrate-binding protein